MAKIVHGPSVPMVLTDMPRFQPAQLVHRPPAPYAYGMLATVCPHCQSLFRTPIGILHQGNGLVRCGDCNEAFNALKHLMACDAPMAMPPSTARVPPIKASNKPWVMLALLVVVAGTASGLGVHHLAEMGHLSLAQMAPLKSFYTAMGISVPPYRNVDGLRLEKTSMRMEDHQFRVEMQLKNSTDIPTYWPSIRISLLDAQGGTMYTQVSSSQTLAKLTQPTMPPHFAGPLYWNIPESVAPSAVNYRLEVLPLLPKP